MIHVKQNQESLSELTGAPWFDYSTIYIFVKFTFNGKKNVPCKVYYVVRQKEKEKAIAADAGTGAGAGAGRKWRHSMLSRRKTTDPGAGDGAKRWRHSMLPSAKAKGKRNQPSQNGGYRKMNQWNLFREGMKGYGLSMSELSYLYHKS